MADLYVLEGNIFSRAGKKVYAKTNHPIKRGPSPAMKRHGFMRRVPGVVYGEPLELLGRSLFKKIKGVAKSSAKLAVAPVTTTYSVTKSASKATVQAVKKPSLKNITKIVTAPTKRLVNETKSNVREAGHVTAESARITSTAASRTLDVTRRVAKRLIKGLAKKVLFKGELLGSVAAVPKNAAKGILIPVATAAVVSNTVTAPAAPIVPVIVNEVIDELYSAITRNIAKGMKPDKAAEAAKAELDKLEPGEENDPKAGGSGTILLVGGGIAILAFILLRKK